MPGETSNGVSGVVHGPSVQARQILGDVHIHQPPVPLPGPLPPPCQLPPPGLLISRDADLQAMDAARQSADRRLRATGSGENCPDGQLGARRARRVP